MWELKDLLVKLRDKYVEAGYLARMEGILTEIRDRLLTGKRVIEIRFPRKDETKEEGPQQAIRLI